MSPRISVVVPFFDNGDVLDDCLRSIAAQTFTDLEVIMVDDGSTDQGPGVARKWADADPRFTRISSPHGGPGGARNRGVERARGEFLAFVDGDDMLPPHAYEVLLHTLESSGSDFVSGAVNRISTGKVSPSALHAQAIKGRKIGTHVTKSPELLYDISVWNKLFRRSFWDAHGLYYPEKMVWEDLQLMTRAHVLARAVDVIPDYIYYWRERAAGALSITQNRTDIQNLRDRVTALLAIDGFLREHAPRKTLRQHQRKALVNDLWLYVRDLYRVSDEYLAEYFDLAGSYLDQVDRRVYRTLPSTHKLAYHLTRRRLRQPLLDYLTWRLDQKVSTIPVVRRHGRLQADLPLRTDRSLKIPARVYRPHWRELDPFVQVESVTWQRGNLVIAGLAYVPSIDISKRRHTNKIVVLRPRARLRPPVVSLATSWKHPQATHLSRQDRYDYAWAGFRCEISPRWFRVAGRWLTGDWDCFILVRGRGVWRPARLHSPALGEAGRPAALEPVPGVQVRPTWVGRHLHVGVLRTPARLAASSLDGGNVALQISLDLTGPAAAAPSGAELVLVRQGGRAARAFPATITVSGEGAQVRGSVPVSALRAAGEQASVMPAAADREGSPEAYSDLYLKPAGQGRIRVTFPGSVSEGRWASGEREVAVERSRYGNVTLAERAPRPVIGEHTWEPEGRLLLRGSYQGPSGTGLELVLRRQDGADEYVVPCRRQGETFSAEIDVAAMPAFGRRLPLHDGYWHLSARATGRDAGAAPLTGVSYDHARLDEISHKKISAGPKLYAFTTVGYDSPVITAEPRLRLSEQSNFNRRVMRKALYPIQSRRPLRDAILFVSWNGKQCTDNPLGIAEELRRRGDDREQLWVVNDYSAAVPPGGRAVLSGTEEYFEALARCRYVIANDTMASFFRKREDQIYLQTWHGTPLKRIGFDIGKPQFVSGTAYFEHLRDDVSKWDLLLSQNPFSTPILRRAFRFEGEICEYGYPRNDVLARGGLLAGELGSPFGSGQDAHLGPRLVRQVVERQAAEHVVHHRAGDPDVRVIRDPGRLEPHVGELLHPLLQRHAVLQADGDGHGERVHHAGQRGALLAELEEHLPHPVVRVGGRSHVALGARHREPGHVGRPPLGQPPPHRPDLMGLCGLCRGLPLLPGGRQWLADFAVVPVDGERLEAELPALHIDGFDVIDRGRLRQVHGLGDRAAQARLDGRHHPHVPHRADGPLAHRAVEHLIVLRVQAGRVDHVPVLGDVLGDRLDLLGLVAENLERPRHCLVDDLHGPAADQLLELHQRQVRLDSRGVAVHHEPDRVVAHQPVRHVRHVRRDRKVIRRLDTAILVALYPLEQVTESPFQPLITRFLQQLPRNRPGDATGRAERPRHRAVQVVTGGRQFGPYPRRQDDTVLPRRPLRLQHGRETRLPFADEPDGLVEVQRVAGVADPDLAGGLAPSAGGTAGGGSQAQREQERPDLIGKCLVDRSDAGDSLQRRPARFEQPAREGAVDRG
jgi:CDP-glycerol glycerophosphotransferase